MAFDYKKEYKGLYLPPKKPALVEVPAMRFAAVQGKGDPNVEGGAYQEALGLLYGVAFTVKMSKLGNRAIEGYFDYVVPPLEGLWRQPGVSGIDYTRKENFEWVSMLRLPDFVTPEVFDWAVHEAAEKKKKDFSAVKYFTYEEGLCVQCMHLGPYDNEPATIAALGRFAVENGCALDLDGCRRHHEIYLSAPRRCAPERLKTVIRQPVKRA